MTFWTDENTRILRDLAAGGHSAGEITAIMRAPSRSAVIGKCYRLKITLKGGTYGIRNAGAKCGRKPNPAPVIQPVVAVSAPILPRPQINRTGIAAHVMALEHGRCKYPIGDPHSPDFRFCMEPCSGSYCLEHAGRAYMKAREPEKRPKVSQLNFARYC